jgi:hypothetical protein
MKSKIKKLRAKIMETDSRNRYLLNDGTIYYHINIYLESIHPSNEAFKDSEGNNIWFDENPYNGLVIHCQADSKSDRSYGWTIGKEQTTGLLELKDLERYVKPLRRIEKHMLKLNSDFGRASTFGNYAKRILKYVKIDEIVSYLPCNARGTPRPCGLQDDLEVECDTAIYNFHKKNNKGENNAA